MVSRSTYQAKTSSTKKALSGSMAKKAVAKPVLKSTVKKATKVVSKKADQSPLSKKVAKKSSLATVLKSTAKTISNPVPKSGVKKSAVLFPTKKAPVSKPVKKETTLTSKKITSVKTENIKISSPVFSKNSKVSAPTKGKNVTSQQAQALSEEFLPFQPSAKKDTRLLVNAVDSDAPIVRVAKAIVKENFTPRLQSNPVNVVTIAVAPNLLEEDDSADPGILSTQEVFDETDRAQHMQLLEQADIGRRARELNRPQTHPDFDGVHCLECDVEIPQKRLEAGRIRCVDCQEEADEAARRSAFHAKARGLA